jgi:hypothetical protein
MLTRWAVAILAVGALSVTFGSGPALAAPHGSPLPSDAGYQLGKDFGQASSISTGKGVTVAVMSSGVDPSIPGLKGRVTTGQDYLPSTHPVMMTGSLIAGLIAGDGDPGNGTQAWGLAPGARILSLRTDLDDGDPAHEPPDVNALYAKAIRYATGHGAQVIYIDSNADEAPSLDLESAVRDAIAGGVVIVADDEPLGAGDAYTYPSSLPGVIGVGTVTLPDAQPPWNNVPALRNESILVAGPGNTFNEPGPAGPDYELDGPEAAASLVAATAALVKSAFPHLSPALVGRAIAWSARYRPAGGYNTTLGFGLVNPDGALQEAATLSRATHTQAAAGQSATATFRSGAPLPPIEAVHHAPAKLAACGAALAVGLLCLAAALVVWRRRSRAGRAAPARSEQLAEPQ